MSLDLSFYSQEKECVDMIEVPEDFYAWLGKSDFSKISQSEPKEMKVDGESTEVSVVVLDWEARRKYSDFFRDEIVKESDKMLKQLGDAPSKEEYSQLSSRLKLLQDLRKQIEDEKIKYLNYLG